MLVRALFAVLGVATIVATMTLGGLASARALTYRRAAAFVPAGYDAGLAQLLATVAASVRSGTAIPATISVAPVCASHDVPCGFTSSERITLTTTATPQPSSPCGGESTNCAVNLQAHPIVGESRVAVRIDTSIVARSGELVVVRGRYVTLRTFGVPPFVAIAGERDGSDGGDSTAPEGEDAGVAGSATADDTRIHLRYFNAQTGTYDAGDANRWATQGWSNANGNASGWSR